MFSSSEVVYHEDVLEKLLGDGFFITTKQLSPHHLPYYELWEAVSLATFVRHGVGLSIRGLERRCKELTAERGKWNV